MISLKTYALLQCVTIYLEFIIKFDEQQKLIESFQKIEKIESYIHSIQSINKLMFITI